MFKLSTRKLQKLNASLYVCLPISWTRNNNLSKLSKVNISLGENDKTLILTIPEVKND